MNRNNLAALFASVLLASACGGGSLKYTIKDEVLYSIGSTDKGAILAAQNEASIATHEQNKATSDAKAAKNELDITENEEKAAKLKLDSAKVSKQAADQSADLNRKSAAAKDVHLAELQLKVSQSKTKWVEAKKKYFDLLAESAELHAWSAQTKVELEKARLAQAKGIKPSEDFNVGNFETQNMERQRKWDEARNKSEQKRLEVERAASNYNQLQQQWNSETGAPQQNGQPNPYAPNNQPASPTYNPSPQGYPQQPLGSTPQYQQNQYNNQPQYNNGQNNGQYNNNQYNNGQQPPPPQPQPQNNNPY